MDGEPLREESWKGVPETVVSTHHLFFISLGVHWLIVGNFRAYIWRLFVRLHQAARPLLRPLCLNMTRGPIPPNTHGGLSPRSKLNKATPNSSRDSFENKDSINLLCPTTNAH